MLNQDTLNRGIVIESGLTDDGLEWAIRRVKHIPSWYHLYVCEVDSPENLVEGGYWAVEGARLDVAELLVLVRRKRALKEG